MNNDIIKIVQNEARLQLRVSTLRKALRPLAALALPEDELDESATSEEVASCGSENPDEQLWDVEAEGGITLGQIREARRAYLGMDISPVHPDKADQIRANIFRALSKEN